MGLQQRARAGSFDGSSDDENDGAGGVGQQQQLPLDDTTNADYEDGGDNNNTNKGRETRRRRRTRKGGGGLTTVGRKTRRVTLRLYAFAVVTVSLFATFYPGRRFQNRHNHRYHDHSKAIVQQQQQQQQQEQEEKLLPVLPPPPPPPPSGTNATTKTTTATSSSSNTKNHAYSDNEDNDGTSSSSSSTTTTTTKVAFAVTVTGCDGNNNQFEFPISDPAAVLKYSIHRASVHGTLGGRYDYDMYAIYHPDAEECTLPLQNLGYKLLKRNTFVQVKDIEGKFLRKRMPKSGCCGEKELIKFEAYTLTDYPVVVLLDLDCLILKPMDDIFDMMILGSTKKKRATAAEGAAASAIRKKMKSIMMWPNHTIPKQVNAFYTHDYYMINPGDKHLPVQGGFLALRPSLTAYNEFKDIVRIGDFRAGEGWGDSGIGVFWGGVTFQGLVPYYYVFLHPGESIELSPCIYNHLNNKPKKGVSGGSGKKVKKCLTGEDQCEDCRKRPLKDIVSNHFTLCGKPWDCRQHNQKSNESQSCRRLYHEWYKARSELEQTWKRSGRGNSTWHGDHFYGYCNHGGRDGYIKIQEPYGMPIEIKRW